MLNQAGTTFTTAMLIADTYQPSLNSSVDSIPPFTMVNGFQASAALELQSIEGVFLNARLTNTEQGSLNVCKGMQMYNNDINAMQFYYGGAVNDWVTLIGSSGGGGDPNDIVIFGASPDILSDSGVKLLLDLNNLNYYTGVLTGNSNFTAMNSFAQGINVVNDITTAQNIYASGINVLDELQDGSRNIALGIRCAINLVSGDDNFFAGNNVFSLANLGNQNVLLGNNVLAELSDADDNSGNTCLGYNIGATVVAASQSVAVGTGIAQLAGLMGGCTFVGYGIASEAGGAELLDLTAVGAFALQSVQTGAIRNTAVGWSALQSLTTAGNCTAVGYQAGANITDSDGTFAATAIGDSALLLATNSSGATAVGYQAGASQSQYTRCTFLGYMADANQNGLTNASAIGQGAVVGADNSMVLGAVGTNVGIGTPTPVANFHNFGSEAARYITRQNSELPYTVAANDNVIICYPSGNKVVTIPDSDPSNQGLMYRFVNAAGNGGDNITVQTTSNQPIDSNNTLGPSFTKTFMAVYTPFLSPVYRWQVVSGNDESP